MILEEQVFGGKDDRRNSGQLVCWRSRIFSGVFEDKEVVSSEGMVEKAAERARRRDQAGEDQLGIISS